MTGRSTLGVSLCGFALGFFTPSFSSADIFRQVGSDGVESFTDAPVEDAARLILREPGTGGDSARKPPKKVGARAKEGRQRSSAEPEASPARLPVEGVITSEAGWRSDPVDGLLRNHQGVDIAVPEGTPVKAVAAGRVRFSGVSNGYGNTVVIEHEAGLFSLYAHHVLNCVWVGQRVEADDVIALSGASGRSTGPHLHFEVWRDGFNLTSSYLQKGSLYGPPAYPSAHGGDELIRSIILADGSVLLTNLGLVSP